MKKLEAVVRPERITVVRQRLQELGVSGMTIFDASGWSKMKSFIYSGEDKTLHTTSFRK